MRRILGFIATSVLFIFLFVIPETNSVFNKTVSVTQSNFQTAININFYARDDKKAVGLEIFGIQDFDKLTYEITYTHTSDLGDVDELVEGSIDNFAHSGTILEEWVILGSCSTGGVCTYHTGIKDVNLTINLKQSGIITKTLTDTLSL